MTGIFRTTKKPEPGVTAPESGVTAPNRELQPPVRELQPRFGSYSGSDIPVQTFKRFRNSGSEIQAVQKFRFRKSEAYCSLQ